jgi:hypothetical protein
MKISPIYAWTLFVMETHYKIQDENKSNKTQKQKTNKNTTDIHII